jgi:hypothetical protein
MPYTRRQVRYLLSSASPLSGAQQDKMKAELHADPALGHKRKGESMKLNAAARKAIPTAKFGLPGSRKYPMPDRAHAANARARATQQVNKGALSPASAARIRAKANRILGG